MSRARDSLNRIDKAIPRFDQALEALRQIPKRGEERVAVDGLEHELIAIALSKRLQTLRDEVTGENRAE